MYYKVNYSLKAKQKFSSCLINSDDLDLDVSARYQVQRIKIFMHVFQTNSFTKRSDISPEPIAAKSRAFVYVCTLTKRHMYLVLGFEVCAADFFYKDSALGM
jgi:hypothetical protein